MNLPKVNQPNPQDQVSGLPLFGKNPLSVVL